MSNAKMQFLTVNWKTHSFKLLIEKTLCIAKIKQTQAKAPMKAFPRHDIKPFATANCIKTLHKNRIASKIDISKD